MEGTAEVRRRQTEKSFTSTTRDRGDGPPRNEIRQTANSIEQQVMSINEKLLNEIFTIYMDKHKGLARFGKMLDCEVRVPRRKITVLLLGNHSAGKSSFINWYIEDEILKTGVAIETQGFCFVTCGKRRECLKGEATLQLYPHLRPMKDMPGVLDFLTTEVSTSRAKKFNMVTFIDTPGLVDGDMHYPFDVNENLLWLGDMADLVFVFFDPMGQALCKRTLSIVEKLWATHSDKMRLYLAKADEAGNETDRQKVLMQIVQELCKRPGLNRTGFDMPTIYLPEAVSRPTKCANQIQDVCQEIKKVIDQTIQTALNNLEKDCDYFRNKVTTRLRLDTEAKGRNWKKNLRSLVMGSLGLVLPIVLLASMIVANTTPEAMRQHIGPATDSLRLIIGPVATLWTLIPTTYHLQIIIIMVVISGLLLIFSRFSPSEQVLPARDTKTLRSAAEIIAKYSDRKKEMYTEYLKQSLTDADFYD